MTFNIDKKVSAAIMVTFTAKFSIPNNWIVPRQTLALHKLLYYYRIDETGVFELWSETLA